MIYIGSVAMPSTLPLFPLLLALIGGTSRKCRSLSILRSGEVRPPPPFPHRLVMVNKSLLSFPLLFCLKGVFVLPFEMRVAIQSRPVSLLFNATIKRDQHPPLSPFFSLEQTRPLSGRFTGRMDINPPPPPCKFLDSGQELFLVDFFFLFPHNLPIKK